jgi:hypothetical protein
VTDYSVNPERGEVLIVLDGASYPMRPSYEAMVAIEEATGASIEELWLRCTRLSGAARSAKLVSGVGLKLKDMAAIVSECVKASGKQRKDSMLTGFSAERVGELIAKKRWEANVPIADILTNMLFGGADAKKDAPASPATSTSEPAAT